MSMEFRISEDITLTLTKQETIEAYKHLQECEEEWENASKCARQAYEDAFITGRGYDRTDFYDWVDAEHIAEMACHRAYEALCAC